LIGHSACLTVGYDPADETDPLRLVAVDDPSGQDEILRPGGTDGARKALRAACTRGHGEAHLRQAEPGMFGRDPQIACERKLQPTAERIPLDGGDGRYRQAGEAS